MPQDLHQLLMEDDQIRVYFMSLPVRVQLTVHKKNDDIKTAEELHRYVDFLTKRN